VGHGGISSWIGNPRGYLFAPYLNLAPEREGIWYIHPAAVRYKDSHASLCTSVQISSGFWKFCIFRRFPQRVGISLAGLFPPPPTPPPPPPFLLLKKTFVKRQTTCLLSYFTFLFKKVGDFKRPLVCQTQILTWHFRCIRQVGKAFLNRAVCGVGLCRCTFSTLFGGK
jgi:hypothetical protein